MKQIIFSALAASLALTVMAKAGDTVELGNDNLTLRWIKSNEGWHLVHTEAFGINGTIAKNQHSIIFSALRPDDNAIDHSGINSNNGFPEEQYRYILPSWKEATTAVALNRAGQEYKFLPQNITKTDDRAIMLSYESKEFSVNEHWHLSGDDVCVSIILQAGIDGWYSIASPSIIAFDSSGLDFAIIPGVLHGNAVSNDFPRAYAYGWGLPNRPVLFRERSTSTLTSINSGKNGMSLAVTAEPGTAAEPWNDNKRNTGLWRLGLSAMNRSGEITPTLYHPVLGQDSSYMKAGETRTFNFRLTFGNKGWWPLFKHAADDIYRFSSSLALRHNHRSLTDRLYGIHRYVVNDSTSKWHTVICEGDTIGAQEYLGGVYMAKKDAMKNADYGAMWMLGAMTGDTLLTKKRLPYALNFKLKQINKEPGFLDGASRGQYYLRDSKRFVEEWGPYTEPIATTYYLLMDLGNILLFDPDNNDAKKILRKSADWLLKKQKEDGSWAVAYNDTDCSEAFTDLKDYRPTFYGLLIAYRILGDRKYLDGAKKGADWLIENSVNTTCWLGVCGDTRFAPDFATAQAAQAMLDIHDITGESRYLDAAVATAKFYTTSVYTNPIASTCNITVKGMPMQQWQITTSGLSYEHGGIIGSANLHGPILLASHAGMFVRIYRLTGDRLFLDMARSAAIGRDAFVDDSTAIASYYWAAMNRGAGPYPHHAWWQMGWITDYLIAELELRSNSAISFPAGFITPKVGPHRTYGFAEGNVMGERASLVMLPGEFNCDNPNIEIVLARNNSHLFIMLLNDLGTPQQVTLESRDYGTRTLKLDPYGLETITIHLKNENT